MLIIPVFSNLSCGNVLLVQDQKIDKIFIIVVFIEEIFGLVFKDNELKRSSKSSPIEKWIVNNDCPEEERVF